MSTEYEPVQLVVDEVLLNGSSSTYVDNNAVSKLYVDSSITTAVSNLVNNAGPAYDTLKELSDALASSDNNLSTAILNAVAAEKTRAEDAEGKEQSARIAADGVLEQKITDEKSARELDVVNLGSAISGEITNARQAEADLGLRIDSSEFLISEEAGMRLAADNAEVVARDAAILVESTRAQAAEAALDLVVVGHGTALSEATEARALLDLNKFDKAGGAISGPVVLDSYLNFGPNWRVKASADGSKIVFEYLREGRWRTAVPFISKSV